MHIGGNVGLAELTKDAVTAYIHSISEVEVSFKMQFQLFYIILNAIANEQHTAAQKIRMDADRENREDKASQSKTGQK